MLKKYQREIAACVIFALLVALLAVTSSFHPNRYSYQKYYGEHRSQENSAEASANERIADYTWWVEVFTGVLGVTTIGLLVASIFQQRLARDEFNATHRPRVQVRRFDTTIIAGKPITISFAILNIEGTAASDFKWNVVILLLDSIGAIHGLPKFPKEGTQSSSDTLAGGEALLVPVSGDTIDMGDVIQIENKTKFLHVVGFVTYLDKAGVSRMTGFFRYYDVTRRRFRVVDDPDYEYQD